MPVKNTKAVEKSNVVDYKCGETNDDIICVLPYTIREKSLPFIKQVLAKPQKIINTKPEKPNNLDRSDLADSVDPDQTALEQSDQGLHCLLIKEQFY